ncbi:DUF2933 domain-containing protein [Staphylococcus epidermidis]|uniref:DUF2933 domain-containing protein n=1 Tax=Staphylococcus epidermidis TaxID=1282 RepID=UPI001C3C4B72|nr:DUF2933 domain-containing protein [Staphylococcus epidermidis]MBV5133978.1 DUF2933 domain-containing protein [Staphylococcus epidermidis]
MEWALLLVFLLCPLMMLFMHRGHKGHNHDQNKGHDHDQNKGHDHVHDHSKL